jgi:hypothetical protein
MLIYILYNSFLIRALSTKDSLKAGTLTRCSASTKLRELVFDKVNAKVAIIIRSDRMLFAKIESLYCPL